MENRAGLDDAEILKNVIQKLRISTRKFALELEVTPPAIYNITKGINKLSSDMIDKIIKIFPEVNYMYLKHGTEPVLKTEGKLIQNQHNLFNSYKEMDYSLESFLTLKSIDSKLGELLELLKDQKKADQ